MSDKKCPIFAPPESDLMSDDETEKLTDSKLSQKPATVTRSPPKILKSEKKIAMTYVRIRSLKIRFFHQIIGLIFPRIFHVKI